MPTTLTLCYTAYVEVSVPNAVARKLMDGQDGVYGDLFYTRHGNLFYKNDAGEEVEIVGEAVEVDYKRTSEGFWGDEEESDEETEEKDEKKDEEEDCLANNPECVSCGIHLNEDDMGVWEEDKSKPPKCESCLDEEEDEEDE